MLGEMSSLAEYDSNIDINSIYNMYICNIYIYILYYVYIYIYVHVFVNVCIYIYMLAIRLTAGPKERFLTLCQVESHLYIARGDKFLDAHAVLRHLQKDTSDARC